MCFWLDFWYKAALTKVCLLVILMYLKTTNQHPCPWVARWLVVVAIGGGVGGVVMVGVVVIVDLVDVVVVAVVVVVEQSNILPKKALKPAKMTPKLGCA